MNTGLLKTAVTVVISFQISCKSTSSDLKTVDIVQSEVKNKKKIGFCWAYATTDFLESEYLKNGTKQLNLSEEYLGFYRIAEHIRTILNTKKTPEKILKYVSCQRFQGLHIMKSTDTQRRGGFELSEKYGAVPEDVYTVKFEDEGQRSATFLGIKRRLETLLKRKAPKEVTDAEIQEYVISGISVVNGVSSADQEFPSQFTRIPPSSFSYEGKEWTPQTFYKNYVNADLTGYSKFEFTKEDEFAVLISLIKKTLASGVSVPLGFGVDRNHLFREGNETVFSGKRKVTESGDYSGPVNVYKSAPDPLKGEGCDPKDNREYQQGRHAVIITDFVNEGGAPGGSLDSNAIQGEVDRPADKIAYFIIKNSWGIDEEGHEGDEAGSAWLSSRSGYYRVDKEYIVNSLKLGVAMNITVPKAIATK
jgi:hypothetical protein